MPTTPLGNSPAVTETHVSTVFFSGDRAYKLLKPITTSFLDFGSTELRLQAVDDEVRLNRRMAPDVYLGSADVIENGEIVDRIIVMRRLPSDRRLATLLHAGEGAVCDVEECLRAVAKRIGAFHEAQPPLVDAVDIAGRDAVRGNWTDSIADMRPLVGTVFDSDVFERVSYLALRYLDSSEELFASRLADGFVRDGHGDLTAEDTFCLDDGPEIIDCLAFAPRLRISDVLADIGFMVMDVDRLAGPAMAQMLWKYYSEFTNEHHPDSLAEHYVAYRAHVRAKVEALRFQQGDAAAASRARSYLELSLRHLERAKRRLVVIGGSPGTGKTSLARTLSDELGWVAIGSDGLRKELTGRGSSDHSFVDPGEGIYSKEVTDAVYTELLRRAADLLARGESVIVDASFNAAHHRIAARSCATEGGAELFELQCVLDPIVAEQRIVERLRKGTDPSDAHPEILGALQAQHEPWPEAMPIPTGGTRDEAAAAAVAFVSSRLR